MERRAAVLLALLCAAAPMPASEVSMAATRSLRGPHQVGFRVEWARDTSRPDWSGLQLEGGIRGAAGRPVPIAIWYPARRGRAAPMPHWRYLALRDASDGGGGWAGDAARGRRREAIDRGVGEGLDREHVAEWLDREAAFLDARVAPGRHPLLVFSPSMLAHPASTAVLLEALASRGFVVASHPSFGARSGFMTTAAEDLDQQARDIAFVLGRLLDWSAVDGSRVAVAGHSWGGLAAVLAASRDPRIRAIASLDGSEEMWRDTLEAVPGYSPLALEIPFLRLSNPRGVSRMSWGQFESLLAAPRTRIHFRTPVPHFDFVSSNLERSLLHDPAGAGDEAAHLLVVVDAVTAFLERSLGDDAAQPSGSPAARGDDELVTLEGSGPIVTGARAERLVDLFGTAGEGPLLERAGRLLAGPAPEVVATQVVRAAETLLWTGRADPTVLALLRLVEARFPSDPLVLELIGDVYLWNLDRPAEAEPFYRRALAVAPGNRRLTDYLEQIEVAKPD